MMLAKPKITALALLATIALVSCGTVREDYEECGVWLEFVFDHNMEYADSFDRHVATVDVYLFDRSGRFVKTVHAATDDLVGRKRMFLGDLKYGEYKILTVGNLTEHFRFTDSDGGDFVPNVSTIEQAVSALKHDGTVSHEFSHFYFGQAVTVNYNADLSVYRVPLIRQTNRFNVVLRTAAGGAGAPSPEPVEPKYIVAITAPEWGAYDWMNNPVSHSNMTYHPHSPMSRLDDAEEKVTLHDTNARLNTMRLLEDEGDGYRIAIRDAGSGVELWGRDLLALLAATKPDKRPDGTELPRAEYFDREGDWEIVIVYGSASGDGAFTALKIVVNNWIVWQQGVGL